MSWYNTQGPCQNYVLFSKVRYIRNPAKLNFSPLGDKKKLQEITAKLTSLLTSNGFRGESTVNGVTPAILSLAERQLVESDFVYADNDRSLYLNDPCNLTISIGGRNLISISSVTSGLSLIEAKNLASEAEEMLDREISFAYNERVGYLSPNCSECGSGLALEAALYLPSLRQCNSLNNLERNLSEIGIKIAPMFIHENADIYKVTFVPHFLADEDASAVFFSDTVSSIVEKEKNALGMFFSGKGKILYEDARRALGTLLFCESINEGEMLSLLSSIRLCLCIGEVGSPSSLPSLEELNFLVAEGLSASVIATSKEICTSENDCDHLRAALLSRYIERKNEVT